MVGICLTGWQTKTISGDYFVLEKYYISKETMKAALAMNVSLIPKQLLLFFLQEDEMLNSSHYIFYFGKILTCKRF